MTDSINDKTALRNVLVLIIAGASLGSQMPMLFILGGLAGQYLSSNPCLATLPISLIVLGSMVAAPILSEIMQKYGRKIGFFIGAMGGTLGAALGSAGLFFGSFAIFLIGSLFTGIYMAAQGFYRFAAIDTASRDFKPKAISYVLAGGIIAAIIGPQLVKLTSQQFAIPFLGTYLTIIFLNIFGSLSFFMLDLPAPQREKNDLTITRSRSKLIKTPQIAVAIICAIVGYSLMNLMMTSTPLAVIGCGFTESQAADIVSAHVLAMFLPSFFTGHLIVKFGVQKIISVGLLMLIFASFSGLNGITIFNFYFALIFLGIGWNFTYVGATTMLSDNHNSSERGRIQGINDFLVFGSVTLASLASGGLMNCSGTSPVDGWFSVNLAMLPLILLAGTAIYWLRVKTKRA